MVSGDKGILNRLIIPNPRADRVMVKFTVAIFIAILYISAKRIILGAFEVRVIHGVNLPRCHKVGKVAAYG